jgi:hypothetical protein
MCSRLTRLTRNSFCFGRRHKDDNAAYNARKMRHHRPIQAEILYYPQATTLLNGPTFVVPYSHYWTTNHESSEGNFSGPDHLDFWQAPASEPAQRQAQLAISVRRLGWPLVKAHPVLVPAGSFVIISHNTYHRGSRKLDSIGGGGGRPRFMWRMYCYRTTEPPRAPPGCTLRGAFGRWADTLHDELTDTPLGPATPPEAIWAWDANLAYVAGVTLPPLAAASAATVAATAVRELWAAGEAAEPSRVGAAYALARAERWQPLCDGLRSERESVRRASAYGAHTPPEPTGARSLGPGTTVLPPPTPKLLTERNPPTFLLRISGWGRCCLEQPTTDDLVIVAGLASLGSCGRSAAAAPLERLLQLCVSGQPLYWCDRLSTQWLSKS